MKKRILYKKALALRLGGRSYTEINRKLGIAKSTLSGWFSKVKLSQAAIDRLKKIKGREITAHISFYS